MTRIPPECVRLAAELRLLRERSGLSLSALAVESAYSKSSWQRYLTGRALPPWLAVRALCVLAGEPEPRLRAVWELAETAWSRRGAIADAPGGDAQGADAQDPGASDAGAQEPAGVEARPPATEPVPEPAGSGATVPGSAVPGSAVSGPGRSPRWRTAAAVGATVVLLAVLLGFTGHPWTGSGASAATAAPSTEAFHVGCTGTACDGLDPGVEKCGVEPRTLLHRQTRSGFGLEIRYSPTCRAAWARVWSTRLGDVLTFTAPGRPRQSVTVTLSSEADGFVYTALAAVTGPATRLTACLHETSARTPRCYSVPSP
ncbi:DUF2690 domain-containing protein [Streptomyces sp. NPDC101175]|uniref:helix-turn-helix domain-containing protein n=1 Tax=Streptomyces sp. NPDC101175 TaxID=3366123 RepID=UPI0038367256